MLNRKRVLFMLLAGFFLFLMAFVDKAMDTYTSGGQSNADIWMRIFGTCTAFLAISIFYAIIHEDQPQRNGA